MRPEAPIPQNYAEERDQRWIECNPHFRPLTEFGHAYKAWLRPDTITRVINHPPNSTALINER